MHIPDGFLDVRILASLAVVSAGAVALSARSLDKSLGEKQVPMMGVLAAFIFAAQLVNFPVPGGTSGHLMGGLLAAVLLGPAAGVIIMSVVLIVQSLLLQDGGVTALGANIFNMGIIGSAVSYFFFRVSISLTLRMKFSLFFGAWLSIVLAAFCCAVELAVSGAAPLKLVLPAMVLTHSVIGLGEAFITLLVVTAVMKIRPDLLRETIYG